MPKVTIKGKGSITLSDSRDFKAQGGEANIYVQGGKAFKVWHDPKALPPIDKIRELQALSSDRSFIIPEDILLDGRSNHPVGVTMRYVDKTFVLCQLFPKAFRDRMNLDTDTVIDLVRSIQDGMNFAHSKDILIVDLNEMNFLVTEDFKDVLFIDTTTYQTKNFPATALMESVRDRHNKEFSVGTDYFAFAVVSFNLFVGINPYRGKYPPIDAVVEKDKRLDVRMQKNISVLHPGVHVPGACLPFDVIPSVYRSWFKAVLEEGKRIAPPKDLRAVMHVFSQPLPVKTSQHFAITLYFTYDDEVSNFNNNVVLTRRSIYINNRLIAPAPKGAHIGVTPKLDHTIVAHIESNKIILNDVTSGNQLRSLDVYPNGLMSYQGKIYVHSGENLFEITYIERADSTIIPGARRIANVMPRATELYQGVAIQYMLKSYYAILVPESEKSYQVRLKELDGYKIIEAKFDFGVLMIIAGANGKYDKLIYRFDKGYADYDLLRIEDIPYTGLNFTVRPDGMVLHMNYEDELEVFRNTKGSVSRTVVADTGLQSDAKLMHLGTQSMFARGSQIFKFSVK